MTNSFTLKTSSKQPKRKTVRINANSIPRKGDSK